MDTARILAITFSNKAAEEMAERLEEAFPYEPDRKVLAATALVRVLVAM